MKYLLIIVVFSCNLNVNWAISHYIDPSNGSIDNDGSLNSPWSTLQEVVEAGYINTFRYQTPYTSTSGLIEVNPNGPIKAGDTLVLATGLHGRFELTGAHNSNVITVVAAQQATPILHSIFLRSASNWRFDGLEVSNEPYGEYGIKDLIDLNTHSWQGPVHNIHIVRCALYSTTSSSTWTREDWLENASSGIYVRANNVLIEECSLLNMNFGINCVGDNIVVKNSVVENFAGDGMRALGQNQLIEGNVIKNCYKINENHDDGIQSFNLDTYNTRNITIRGNLIINNEDPEHPLAGALQGIGCFDGPFHDWIIENNIIVVDHWHGISLYGAYNCVIRNNTVLDPSPGQTPGPSWIRINPDKDGTPSDSNLVVNNVSNSVSLDGAWSIANTFLTTSAEYDEHFVDFTNHFFALLPNSTLIDAGLDSLASSVDFYGLPRPQGIASDIGAIEYQFPVAAQEVPFGKQALSLYPNPVVDIAHISSNAKTVTIFTVSGRNVGEFSVENQVLNLSILVPGQYFAVVPGFRTCAFIKL